MFLILLDVALISWALAIGSTKEGNRLTLTSIAGTDLCISVFFIFEIGLRMFSMTPQVYFSKRYWYNALDSIFITLGFVFGIVELVLMQVMQYSLNIVLIYFYFRYFYFVIFVKITRSNIFYFLRMSKKTTRYSVSG